jgi:hypothetical protein
MTTNLLSVFNDHFAEFVSDIQNVFPDDTDILTAKNALLAIRKANPKLLVRIWIKYVVTPYQDKITAGDIKFFIDKDYASDLVRNDNADKIMESIDRLRNPVKQMSAENQAKTMKYIQNLSKFIRDKFPEAIEIIAVSEYAYKIVAVDTSLYMCKFKAVCGEERWLAEFIRLVATLRANEIHCVFVIDFEPLSDSN